MEIKVLKTTIASKNQTGTQCFEYLKGEIYDIYDELAEIFLKEGWGKKAIDNLEDTEETIEELENKAIDNLEDTEETIEELENKAIDNLENKQFKTKKVNKNAE